VWAVAWANPKFGTKLASASYDRKVIVWSEENGFWVKSYVYSGSELSVNSVAWAPHEHGLMLACASSDGTISILSQNVNSNEWGPPVRIKAHDFGVNSVSWAPTSIPLSILNVPESKESSILRFVSGGCDNLVKIWAHDKNGWKIEATLEGHADWVRDVAWSPNVGLPYSTIASCSQEGLVIMWVQSDRKTWSKEEIRDPIFQNTSIWRVSWSTAGNILAVSSGDNTVTLWKENLEHQWKCISNLSEQQ